MASNIDVTKPAAGSPTTASVRANFAAAKAEIEALQAANSAPGAAATVAVGTVTTGAAGSSAAVTNAGTNSAAVFNFTIPKGDSGTPGAAATVTVGTVTTGAPGSSAAVTNTGTPYAAVLNFTIPQGTAGTGGSGAVSSVAGKTGAVTLAKADVGLGNVDNTSDAAKPISTAQATAIAAKEPGITAGTTAQYWRGDKAWRDFATDVRAAVLTGLSVATATAADAADSVLASIGKLQAQITALTTVVSGKQATLVSGSNIRTINGNTLLGSTDLTIGGSSAVTPLDKGTIAGSATFTVSASSYQKATVGASGYTVVLAGWPTSGTLGELTIELVNGGSQTATMPSVRWLTTASPGYNTSFASAGKTLYASGTNFITLWSYDGGATVWGQVL